MFDAEEIEGESKLVELSAEMNAGASGRRVEFWAMVVTAGDGMTGVGGVGGGVGKVDCGGADGLQMWYRLCKEFQLLDAELVRVLQKPPDCIQTNKKGLIMHNVIGHIH